MLKLRRLHLLTLLILFGYILTGCSTQLSAIKTSAKQAEFDYVEIKTLSFLLASFQKQLAPDTKTIHIYIEGDGYSWARRSKPSRDPTPKNSLVFRLAMADSADSVIYLARPCQYLLTANKENCSQALWTSHRYSTEVIQAMNHAIDQMLDSFDSTPSLHLIAYSGGGAIASLLAAKRHDVSALITINANLDHHAWTQYHNDSPLSGSLNSVDVAHDIRFIPQVHFFGKQDKTVPFSTTQQFFDRQTKNNHSHIQVIDSFDHSCCWLKEWPNLLHKAYQIIDNQRNRDE